MKYWFTIFTIIVSICAIFVGFWLGVLYLNFDKTSNYSNEKANPYNRADSTDDNQLNIDHKNSKPDNTIDEGYEGIDNENTNQTLSSNIIKIDTLYSTGEWFVIQAGAFKNEDVADNTYNKFIDKKINAVLIPGNQLMLYPHIATSEAKALKVMEQFKKDDVLQYIPMYVRKLQTTDVNVTFDMYSTYKELYELLGERISGYTRMVADSNSYLLASIESMVNYEIGNIEEVEEIITDIIKTNKQLQEQIEIIFDIDMNTNSFLVACQTELMDFASNIEKILPAIDATDKLDENIAWEIIWNLQGHLFNLLTPQI